MWNYINLDFYSLLLNLHTLGLIHYSEYNIIISWLVFLYFLKFCVVFVCSIVMLLDIFFVHRWSWVLILLLFARYCPKIISIIHISYIPYMVMAIWINQGVVLKHPIVAHDKCINMSGSTVNRWWPVQMTSSKCIGKCNKNF